MRNIYVKISQFHAESGMLTQVRGNVLPTCNKHYNKRLAIALCKALYDCALS